MTRVLGRSWGVPEHKSLWPRLPVYLACVSVLLLGFEFRVSGFKLRVSDFEL